MGCRPGFLWVAALEAGFLWSGGVWGPWLGSAGFFGEARDAPRSPAEALKGEALKMLDNAKFCKWRGDDRPKSPEPLGSRGVAQNKASLLKLY